jgi:hypothetical protein
MEHRGGVQASLLPRPGDVWKSMPVIHLQLTRVPDRGGNRVGTEAMMPGPTIDDPRIGTNRRDSLDRVERLLTDPSPIIGSGRTVVGPKRAPGSVRSAPIGAGGRSQLHPLKFEGRRMAAGDSTTPCAACKQTAIRRKRCARGRRSPARQAPVQVSSNYRSRVRRVSTSRRSDRDKLGPEFHGCKRGSSLDCAEMGWNWSGAGTLFLPLMRRSPIPRRPGGQA